MVGSCTLILQCLGSGGLLLIIQSEQNCRFKTSGMLRLIFCLSITFEIDYIKDNKILLLLLLKVLESLVLECVSANCCTNFCSRCQRWLLGELGQTNWTFRNSHDLIVRNVTNEITEIQNSRTFPIFIFIWLFDFNLMTFDLPLLVWQTVTSGELI
jgi:hypothetical protein